MRKACILTLFVSIFSITTYSFSATKLWTKEFAGSSTSAAAGKSGAVAITTWNSGGANKIYWYDVAGESLAEIDRSEVPYVEFIYHVSDTDLVFYGRDDEYKSFTITHTLNEDNTTTNTKIDHESPSGSWSSSFSYPYLITFDSRNEETVTFSLWLLADQPQIKIVGDIVTGVSGDTLHIRWTSEIRSIYKIQTSTDLDTWTDYTDEIFGDGTTKFEDIPVDAETKYARIIQL